MLQTLKQEQEKETQPRKDSGAEDSISPSAQTICMDGALLAGDQSVCVCQGALPDQ